MNHPSLWREFLDWTESEGWSCFWQLTFNSQSQLTFSKAENFPESKYCLAQQFLRRSQNLVHFICYVFFIFHFSFEELIHITTRVLQTNSLFFRFSLQEKLSYFIIGKKFLCLQINHKYIHTHYRLMIQKIKSSYCYSILLLYIYFYLTFHI